MRYVALLRGVNVGGSTMIKMEELRRLFEALGLTNVVSYINSGNLAFDAARAVEEKLAAKLERPIAELAGRPVQVMIREQPEIRKIIANNPFAGEFKSHKEMHVLFLKAELPAEKIDQLSESVPPGERFLVLGREIYCHLPMGVADSYLGRGQFEKKLQVSATARNWRTVEKLAVL